MTISPRMTVMIAISAVVVCALLATLKRATEVAPRGAVVAALYPPYANVAAMAWQAQHMLPFDRNALGRHPADDPTDEHGHSPVMIYEEDKPLGPAHSSFADISKLGHGRFSYWIGQGLIFSTSDGSDPNSNGRRYWAVVP
jgi:hypothetical protein